MDLLPDREAQTVAPSPGTHRGAEAVSRNRAGTYGEAARTGVPER